MESDCQISDFMNLWGNFWTRWEKKR